MKISDQVADHLAYGSLVFSDSNVSEESQFECWSFEGDNCYAEFIDGSRLLISVSDVEIRFQPSH